MRRSGKASAQALARGLHYLIKNQNKDGSFMSYSSTSTLNFAKAEPCVTVFTNALILQSLACLNVPDSSYKDLTDNLAAWLLKQRSKVWSFNYWPPHSRQAKKYAYPDDLDDTFCALIALYRYNPELISGSCLAHVVRLLVATETQPGGPYRTWLVPPGSSRLWLDVDIAVNSNIAGFLQITAGPLPKLSAYLERAISEDDLQSPYYPSPLPLLYYLSRASLGSGSGRLRLIEYVKRERVHNRWKTYLGNALGISALAQMRDSELHDCDTAFWHLLGGQQSDGSWPAEGFCIDPAQNGTSFYQGGPALTTALALEAITRYQAGQQHAAEQAHARYQHKAKAETHNIVQRELSRLKNIDDARIRRLLQSVHRADAHGEITLLPFLFARSLRLPASDTPPKGTLVSLSKANLYGWLAYTAYDTLLDERDAHRSLLPLANISLRRSVACFREALPNHMSFQRLVDRTFDTIDCANTWELAHCRFSTKNGQLHIEPYPKYAFRSHLAERSKGHLLTPLGVLASMGAPLSGVQTQAVHKGLHHFLIARQCSDDLHDWESDVAEGRISYVVARVLSDMGIKAGTSHDLDALIPRMRNHLWRHSLVPLVTTALNHLMKSRSYLSRSQLLAPQNDLYTIFDVLESSLSKALRDQSRALDFVATLRKNGAAPPGPLGRHKPRIKA